MKLNSIDDLKTENQKIREAKEIDVLFFLPDKEYGYGYVYDMPEDEENPYRTCKFQDRFSKEEIAQNDFINEILGGQNRKMYIGDLPTAEEAVMDILNFWFVADHKGMILSSDMNFKEAIAFGEKEGLDYLILLK